MCQPPFQVLEIDELRNGLSDMHKGKHKWPVNAHRKNHTLVFFKCVLK